MKISLGTWRLYLALMVVISHLWGRMIGGPAAYSVWGFFVMSGYLMTYVLRYKYGSTVTGLAEYGFNRFIRIFPSYWIACVFGIISLVVLTRLGLTLTALNPQFVMPNGMLQWFINITLLPLNVHGPFLVPVSGALAVEVGVYILVPFMAFSRKAAILGLILSIAFNLHYGVIWQTFGLRYSMFLTCFGVFAFGSLVCHYRDVLKKFELPKLSLFVWVVHSFISVLPGLGMWPWTYGLYASVILSGWVVLSLASVKSSKLDTFLGELSYPVYLFHTTVAVWVMLLLHKNQVHSFKLFFISLILTLLLSTLLITTVDKYFKRMKIQKTPLNDGKPTEAAFSEVETKDKIAENEALTASAIKNLLIEAESVQLKVREACKKLSRFKRDE